MHIKRYTIFVCLLLASFGLRAQGDCACTNCPVPITDNGEFDGFLEIQNTGPDDLVDNPLQELCFNITHTWIGDLVVGLTSPGGASYLVMADVNNFPGGCGTNADNIDICFQQGSANPLTNNTEYVCNGGNPCLVGNWTLACGGVTANIGTQSPACDLNDFNAFGGTVSGTWALNIADVCGQDVGFLNDWSLSFADNSGISCSSTCAANGGDLDFDPISACVGSPDLMLNLFPSYTGAEPDPATYGYTYLVASSTGLLIEVSEEPDLSFLDPGDYQVCGLSYLLDDAGSLPSPDGSITIADIDADITGPDPSFCGSLSASCVDVTVNLSPEIEADPIEIQCGANFDLTTVNILDEYGPSPPDPSTVTFHATDVDAMAGSPELPSPIVDLSATYWIRVTYDNGCFDIAPIDVIFSQLDLDIEDPSPVCEPEVIDLSLSQIADNGGQDLTVIEFYFSEDDANNRVNEIVPPEVTVSGTYWVRVETETGCVAVAPIEAIIYLMPVVEIETPPEVCSPDSINLADYVTVLEPTDPGEYNIYYYDNEFDAEFGPPSPELDDPWVSESGTYYVRVENLAGCFTVASIEVVVEVGAVITISGMDTICGSDEVDIFFTIQGIPDFDVEFTDGNEFYDFSTGQNNFTYSVIIEENSTFTITSIIDGNGNICDPIIEGEAVFTVFPELEISNLTEQCDGQNYTVSFQITGGDPGTYTVDPAGTLNNGTFTSNPIPGGQDYQFVISDGTSCEPVTIMGNVLCNCDTEAGTMSNFDTLNVCVGDTLYAMHNGDHVLDADDVLSFILHDQSGNIAGTVAYDGTDPAVYFLPGVTQTNEVYFLSAVAGNNVGGIADPNDPCYDVAPGTPVVFRAIPSAMVNAGSIICSGADFNIVVSFTGVAPFSFDLDINGSIQNPYTTNDNPFTIPVNPTENTTYTIQGLSDRYCSSDESWDLMVDVFDVPSLVSFQEVCNQASTAYDVVVELTGGDSLNYTNSGINGTWNGNIFTSDPVTSGDAYSFFLLDANGCDSIEISGIRQCDCNTFAGTMNIVPVLRLCDTETAVGVHNGDEVLESDDVFYYILHDGSGTQIGPNIYGVEQIPEFTFEPGTGMQYGVTYYISALAGMNDGTGSLDITDLCKSIAAGQPVMFFRTPSIDMASAQDICEGECYDIAITLTGEPPFVFEYSVNSITQAPINTSLNDYALTVCPTTQSDYEIVSMSDDICDGNITGNASIYVNPILSVTNLITTCNFDYTGYTVTFDINGGDPGTYQVIGNAGLLNANSFTSDLLISDAVYSFAVFDSYGCDTIELTGTLHCECPTGAGTLVDDALILCEDQNASVMHLGDEMLEADDVFYYILHEGGCDASLGTIIEYSNSQIFDFATIAGLNFGTTYYISTIAATDDGNGLPDFADPCLSVSNCVPVTWYAYPDALIDVTGVQILTCQQTEIILDASASSGMDPLDIQWTTSDGNILSGANSLTPTINQPGTYVLTITNEDSQCADSDQIIIGSDGSIPTINISTPQVLTCISPNSILDATNSSNGPDYSYQWTTSDGNIVIGGNTLQPSVDQPGTYTLTITNVTNNCMSSSNIVVVADWDLPVVEAGTADVLDCLIADITLDGSGSAAGPGITYNWTTIVGNIVSGNTGLNPVVDESAMYYLEVFDSNSGCRNVDSVFVDIDPDAPDSLAITLRPISCHGESDGAIYIDEVIGGDSPFLFSINNNPFTPSQVFQNLGPGNYTITVQDSKGCTWQTTFDFTDPDELIVSLGEDVVMNLGDTAQIMTSINQPIDTFYWTAPNLNIDSKLVSPFVSPDETTAISITVINQNGCSDTDRMLIVVKRDRPVYIPTAFSPNGDNVNDIFLIYGSDKIQNINYLRIFDRWGNQVFDNENFGPNDQSAGWNGMFDGQLMNPAVFVYVTEIEFSDGITEIFEGDITIVR